MILAIVLSAIVLFGWSALSDRWFPTANPPATVVVDGRSVPVAKPEAMPDTPAVIRDRAIVLAESPRLAIRTPRVAGSVNLKGLRLDDLTLTTYRETIAANSPPIRLLSPGGTTDAYFAGIGWTGESVAVPDTNAVWTTTATVLAPGRPVTLSWSNATGQRFEVVLSIDDGYLFTARQRVFNTGTGAVAVRPYAFVSRVGVSKDPDSWTLHVGPMGVFNGSAEYGTDYDDVAEAGPNGVRFASKGGWIGFTDKYWLAAIVPDQRLAVDAGFRTYAGDRYQAEAAMPLAVVQPGRPSESITRIFAGAKEVSLLEGYEAKDGIAQLDRAIDWGWFVLLEKPIFYLLDWLFNFFGNFGVAIILLTVIVRTLLFPVAQKQFASMASMRVLQPKLKVLQERYKDDKPALQAEMLKLYKTEKVNPVAGCLPLLLQAPIFYALYKVLVLTIEMRHQPFVAWIKDLSAPDPMTPVNLFGLLAFTPPAFIAIGVLPILVGITMYLQFKLNPAPADPVQAQVFSIMPWVLMFVMAPFAAGLQLYWTVNNLLSIAQQKWLYSKHPALKEPVPAAVKK